MTFGPFLAMKVSLIRPVMNSGSSTLCSSRNLRNKFLFLRSLTSQEIMGP
ncbi:hypothetical protein OIU76_012181 [Salix suchowensis]|nr:hypothetical protein OIU76_012181 [Salix suchowensis]